MKLVLEYVKKAKVKSWDKENNIWEGLLVYVGITKEDIQEPSITEKVARKIVSLRLITDENGKINYSVSDINWEVLLISNFTLGGKNSKGNKLDFLQSAWYQEANDLFDKLVEEVRDYNIQVKTGFFGENMEVEHQKLGPLTYYLEY